tara:strand:+ start:2766 stop:3317 length:552 start_codon:yes stop_codon:yes gene_type:complete
MKFIVFLILFMSSFDAIPHGSKIYGTGKLQFSFNPNAKSIAIIDKPDFARLKSIESYSWDSILYMQKQNEDLYDKMKIDLENKLYDSLINDSIFVKFFNKQGVKVATIPAYEMSAFTSHQGSNYPEVLHRSNSIFVLAIPMLPDLKHVQFYRKVVNDEILLGVYELEIRNHTHMHENKFVGFQ